MKINIKNIIDEALGKVILDKQTKEKIKILILDQYESIKNNKLPMTIYDVEDKMKERIDNEK